MTLSISSSRTNLQPYKHDTRLHAPWMTRVVPRATSHLGDYPVPLRGDAESHSPLYSHDSQRIFLSNAIEITASRKVNIGEMSESLFTPTILILSGMTSLRPSAEVKGTLFLQVPRLTFRSCRTHFALAEPGTLSGYLCQVRRQTWAIAQIVS